MCKSLGIPSLVMHDYEYSTKTGFIEPNWTLIPDVIPNGAMSKKTNRVLRYPGLKEDVYIPQFRPDASILRQFGLDGADLIVTLRPPATEAHYHNPESDVLFAETVRYLAESREFVWLCFRGAQSNRNKSGRIGQTCFPRAGWLFRDRLSTG